LKGIEYQPLETGTMIKIPVWRSLYEKIKGMISKRGIWVMIIGKFNNWYLAYEQMNPDMQFINHKGGRYIVDQSCIIHNRKFGSMIGYYYNNPNPIKFSWTETHIGKNDIAMTSKKLNIYMLQKIWDDMVGVAEGFDIKKIALYAGCAIIGYFILKRFL